MAILLLFAGIFVMYYNLSYAVPNFEYVVGNMGLIYILAVPLLSMRAIAEERRQRTDQLLYALPISMTKIVIGKYLAQLVVIALPIGVMAFYPLILTLFGTVNLATAYSCLFAYFMLGATLLAIGFFISTLTENQAIAAGVTFLVMLLNYYLASLLSFVPSSSEASLFALMTVALIVGAVLYLMTKNSVFAVGFALLGEIALYFSQKIFPERFENLFSEFVAKMSVFEQFYSFLDGIFDLTAVVYFGAVGFLFLYLSVQALEKRRWS